MMVVLMIIGGIDLAAMIVLGLLIFWDRSNVPEGFDEQCARVDRELEEQGL